MNRLLVSILICSTIYAVNCLVPFERICPDSVTNYFGKPINGFYRYNEEILLPNNEINLKLKSILERGYFLPKATRKLYYYLSYVDLKPNKTMLFDKDTYDGRVNFFYKRLLKLNKFVEDKEKKQIKINLDVFLPAYDKLYDNSKSSDCLTSDQLPPFYKK